MWKANLEIHLKIWEILDRMTWGAGSNALSRFFPFVLYIKVQYPYNASKTTSIPMSQYSAAQEWEAGSKNLFALLFSPSEVYVPRHSSWQCSLTSACPPGVSVLLQRSHFKQNLCQSFPKEVTFSAAWQKNTESNKMCQSVWGRRHYAWCIGLEGRNYISFSYIL